MYVYTYIGTPTFLKKSYGFTTRWKFEIEISEGTKKVKSRREPKSLLLLIVQVVKSRKEPKKYCRVCVLTDIFQTLS